MMKTFFKILVFMFSINPVIASESMIWTEIPTLGKEEKQYILVAEQEAERFWEAAGRWKPQLLIQTEVSLVYRIKEIKYLNDQQRMYLILAFNNLENCESPVPETSKVLEVSWYVKELLDESAAPYSVVLKNEIGRYLIEVWHGDRRLRTVALMLSNDIKEFPEKLSISKLVGNWKWKPHVIYE